MLAVSLKDEILEFLLKPWYIYIQDKFDSDIIGLVFMLVLIVLGLGALWLWWDSFDFFDFMGATALMLAFLLISPLVLFAYIGARMLANAITWARTRVSRADEFWFWQFRYHMRHHRAAPRPLTKKDMETISAIKIDTDIAEDEKDSNVERFLLSGQRDEAINYVREMLHVAKSMRDKQAVARYEKYFLVLRLGKPVSRQSGAS